MRWADYIRKICRCDDYKATAWLCVCVRMLAFDIMRLRCACGWISSVANDTERERAIWYVQLCNENTMMNLSQLEHLSWPHHIQNGMAAIIFKYVLNTHADERARARLDPNNCRHLKARALTCVRIYYLCTALMAMDTTKEIAHEISLSQQTGSAAGR